MSQENSWFNPPPDDAVLWRYMDFTKFMSILAKKSLFFTRLDKFQDPFEGYWPLLASEASTSDFFQKMIPVTLVSCWHESCHESEAMWRLYSRETEGIAIKTDSGSFKQCFTTVRPSRLGRVNYIDYATSFSSLGDTVRPCFFKRQIFEHEHEVRAVIQHILDDGNRLKLSPCFDVGKYYQVDLSILIHEVVVSPYAQDWLVELVQSVADRYNLKAPVVKSPLGDPPKWAS